jgi:hypothetical protein
VSTDLRPCDGVLRSQHFALVLLGPIRQDSAARLDEFKINLEMELSL